MYLCGKCCRTGVTFAFFSQARAKREMSAKEYAFQALIMRDPCFFLNSRFPPLAWKTQQIKACSTCKGGRLCITDTVSIVCCYLFTLLLKENTVTALSYSKHNMIYPFKAEIRTFSWLPDQRVLHMLIKVRIKYFQRLVNEPIGVKSLISVSSSIVLVPNELLLFPLHAWEFTLSNSKIQAKNVRKNVFSCS